jgi:hypothetical protein
MTCSDVERLLPELIDGASEEPQQSDFDLHVSTCAACSDLVSDLKFISIEARQLEATEEPAPRVWVRIAAELRAEGLIRDQESDYLPGRPVLLPTTARRRWKGWWMAPIAAAILAAASYVVVHKPATSVAKQQAPATQTSPSVVVPPTVVTPMVAAVPEPASGLQATQSPTSEQQAARKSEPANAEPAAVLAQDAAPANVAAPSANAEDQQFLSAVSTRAPSMRATYENQLQAVNADIRETQAYVNQHPGDSDARQHLMDAYEQKALLYQIALDRIQ